MKTRQTLLFFPLIGLLGLTLATACGSQTEDVPTSTSKNGNNGQNGSGDSTVATPSPSTTPSVSNPSACQTTLSPAVSLNGAENVLSGVINTQCYGKNRFSLSLQTARTQLVVVDAQECHAGTQTGSYVCTGVTQDAILSRSGVVTFRVRSSSGGLSGASLSASVEFY